MNIFITGASGTLGSRVLNILQNKYHISKKNIYGLTRNEHHIKRLSEYCTPVLGDIRDEQFILKVTGGMDMIMHLAALKHVDLMEIHPYECIKTNLDGTRNICLAQAENGIGKIAFVSTDKAMYPINVYGQCKAISERLVMKNSDNVVCRYGNVFGSKGSIFERLPEIIKKTGTIPITDPEMTRFFITPQDAAEFVVNSAFNKTGIQIPPMKSANILKMLEIAAEKHGITDYRVVPIGLRLGEKIHEDLSETLNSNNCERFTDKELWEYLFCE